MIGQEVIEIALPTPFVPGSAVHTTAAKLQAWVLDQKPEAQVTEGEVASRWGVSRPTAKSAITMLVNDGLLRQEPNKAAYVPKLTEVDVRDLFGARIPLEGEIAQRAAEQRHAPQQAAFQVYAMGQLTGSEPVHEFVEADLGFHLALLESVNSPRLTRLYRAIQGEMHLTMVQSHHVLGPEKIHQEHGEILEAIRQGDKKGASDLMYKHLSNAREKVVARLKDL